MESNELVQWITKLIYSHNIVVFYKSAIWRELRAEVLEEEQRNGCHIHRGMGEYEEATTVHHIKHVRKHPELALTKNNLMCVCKECHYQIHHTIKYKEQLNEEKW